VPLFLEEADLETRFGAGYAVYRDRVACWVPRLERD
jgi:protein-S-isoprenylcysteine O-methyltransferase Ste14